ncbi:MAG: hypothetical protein GY760_26495 [Deltaproteobacteria bacterium]|nr:hypothetical protein [Deltaproteobacteria bacterium]
MNNDVLKELIKTKMVEVGFKVTDPYCVADKLAQAIAYAVVEHIQGTAKVNISDGSIK